MPTEHPQLTERSSLVRLNIRGTKELWKTAAPAHQRSNFSLLNRIAWKAVDTADRRRRHDLQLSG